MPLIHPKGNPASPVWVIVNRPMSGDTAKGYMYSSPMGYVWDKMMNDAGINDYYVTSRLPDSDDHSTGGDWESKLYHYKPPIIIPLGSAGRWLVPEMTKKHNKKTIDYDRDSEIAKYAGSILTSDKLKWPHYIIPTLEPQDIIKQWKLRDIVVSCDLAKASAELAYYEANNRQLNPLPQIDAKINFESFDELLFILKEMQHAEWVSNDIETIYPRKPTKTVKSQFYKILPGYPITIGLAVNNTSGISFNLFRDSTTETRELWKTLYNLLKGVRSVGQNFFNFDANFYEALGFKLPLKDCRDTMILHHLLWAELPHKLQFLARQYTRHPFWKDEGAGWSIKNMDMMKRYNVKDVCVTLEIFHAELAEMKARGLE